MKSAVQIYRENEYAMACGDRDTVVQAIQQVAVQMRAACRAAVEKQLIHGALSLQGKTAVEQADAVLAAIDAVNATTD